VELTALAQPKSSARCMMMLLCANARVLRGSGGAGAQAARAEMELSPPKKQQQKNED